MNYNYVLINAICIASIFAFSGILHEVAHLIMCLILKCKVKEFKVLFLKFIFENNKCNLLIDIKDNEHCSFYSKNLKEVVLVMMVGPIMNFILSIIFGIMCFYYRNFIFFCGFIYNTILVISNISFKSDSDGYFIYKFLKQIGKVEK